MFLERRGETACLTAERLPARERRGLVACDGRPSASATSASNRARVSASTPPISCRFRHAATAWANRSASRSASGPLPTSGSSDRHSSSIGTPVARARRRRRASRRARTAHRASRSLRRACAARSAASSASRSRRAMAASAAATPRANRSCVSSSVDAEGLPDVVQRASSARAIGHVRQLGDPLDVLAHRGFAPAALFLRGAARGFGGFDLVNHRAGAAAHGLLLRAGVDALEQRHVGRRRRAAARGP